MIDIKSLTLDELTSCIIKSNLPKFRAEQIYKWLHQNGVNSFSEMTNLSKDLREKLNNDYYIANCEIEDKYVSQIDDTVKYLFKLHDGEYVESVVMKYKYGYTICISSQVGCKMGCNFCASTLAGFKRNLLPSEMESQVHSAQNDLGVRISHIVLMGIGEPLDNYDNVIRFLKNVNFDKGLNISLRDITLSTCGVVPRIYDLADENMPITLTLSLHAPNDKIRSSMMPVNDKWGVDEVIKACKHYASKTSRRVSFEYTLIKGVNDTTECARQLADRLRGFISHVNLIPVNDVRERGNVRGSDESIQKFCNTLKTLGVNATIRRTLGADINASCGQLRRKKNEGDWLMKIVAKTDKGLVRESNQDAYAVGELPGEVAWAVVCDGMGGAAGGNIASALAVKVISEKINASYNPKMRDSSIKNLLDSAITAANIEVYDMAYTQPDLKGMGTTVVCAIVRDNQAFIAHAGDSRAYIATKDSITQITTDHSMVQDLVNQGKITPQEAEHHPNKNIITRAIGVDKRIDIDFDQFDLNDDETLILCTDGLSNYVSCDDLVHDISDGQYYAFAERLVQRANNNGGGDNITVVAIAN